MLEQLAVKDWMQFNARLQQKKNALRKVLKDRGILKREGNNTYDRYKYFSEAQYKTLFTELFSECGLELRFNELEYNTFEGPEKQANGRMPRIEFSLIDTETGFYESTAITGEGIDKGDKAGYKAYTGALKYYLADTFMVATGDDPETESPDNRMNTVKKEARQMKPDFDTEKKPAPNKIELIKKNVPQERINAFLNKFGLERLEDADVMQLGIAMNVFVKEGYLK